MSEETEITLDCISDDLKKEIGIYDGLMRKKIERIGLNISHREIRNLAQDIVYYASMCEMILKSEEITKSYRRNTP